VAGLGARTRKLPRRVVVALSLVGACGPATAANWVEDYPAVAKQTSAACKAEQLETCRSGLERLLQLTDGRPDIVCRLAHADLAVNDLPAARRHLELCADSGLEMKELASDRALDPLRAMPGFDRIERAYRRAAQPSRDFSPMSRLTDAGLVAEDIVFDPADRSLLFSSVRERKIIRLARDGSVSDLLPPGRPGVWGVFALALDAARGVLWATTIAGPESPPFAESERGRSAVLKLDAHSLAPLARYELGDSKQHGFGDVTLGERGELYVSDGVDGGVYATEDTPEPHLRAIVAPGTMRSPQTPARLSGTSRLLVPDYSRGILVVDLSGGEPKWLPHPPELALFGIDGLYARGRTLIAIQNGTAPERILVMTLDRSCERISRWRTAVARVAELGDPTHGVFVHGEFRFIANSGWDRMAEDGTFTMTPTDAPPAVWRLKLRPGEGARPEACAN
jgi:hypothetical protein